MAKFETREITDKKTWEEFVLNNNPRSFLQSWNWGETNKLVGDKIKRLGFYGDGKLQGVCLMVFQDAKRGKHYLIPGGPIIDWKKKDLVKFAFKTVRGEARRAGSWFVRMRPELIDSGENRKVVVSFGFRKAPMHLHAENTWVLDISKSEDEILAGMRKNTRYDVRKSLKQGLSIETSRDPVDCKYLSNLQKATVERNKFVGFSDSLFKAQILAFGSDDQARLYLVKHKEKVLVAAIIIDYGDQVYYHHSGSSDVARKYNASYFLQWKVIQSAKKRGIKYYDMWGAVPKGAKGHRFAGPSLFKKGFGGEQVDWVSAHDMCISPLYYSTFFFETLRRKFRGL